MLDRQGVEAAYPHGFGLSYTRFSIDAAIVEATAPTVRLRVTLRNAGGRDGRHVVQAYGQRKTGNYAGENLLTGFAVAHVPAGEAVDVTVDISLLALAEWDPTTRKRVAPTLTDVTLEVGSHAHDPDAIRVALA